MNNNQGETGKKQSGAGTVFAKLSARERTLIYALIVFGAIAAVSFLLVLPGLDSIGALENRAEEAEIARDEYSAVIALGQGSKEAIDEARANYDKATGSLIGQTLPEELDKTVTGYFVNAGFQLQTLTISPLTPEQVAPFSAALAPAEDGTGDPAQADAQAQAGTEAGAQAETEQASGDASADTGADATATDAGAGDASAGTADPGAQDISAPIDSYTVTVAANGKWSNFYKLMQNVAGTGGAKITQYQFAEGANGDNSSGTFNITIKFYVYTGATAAQTSEEN
jgi:hypothetical protein